MIPYKFVFDLDDTLYKERHYSLSALRFVGDMIETQTGKTGIGQQLVDMFYAGHADAIGTVCATYGILDTEKQDFIRRMQSHAPNIILREGAASVLQTLRTTKAGFSILTDGRSVTQRAKLHALGLLDADVIIISQELGVGKPDPKGFLDIQNQNPTIPHVYIGDNLRKDFIAPNALGWTTVQFADDGDYTHAQPSSPPAGGLPTHSITHWDQIFSTLGL